MAEYKVNYTQSNFTGGLIAPELYGRNDFNKIKAGAKKLENWTLREAGGLEFRRGTKYITTIPTEAGHDFKFASLDDVLFVLAKTKIFYFDWNSKTWMGIDYPEGFVPNMETLDFIELKQRLYFFDGTSNKLSQIRFNKAAPRVPYAEITLFEGALPDDATINAAVIGTAPTPSVMIDYTYGFSVSRDAEHETIYKASNTVQANVELGQGSTTDPVSQRIDLTIQLPQDIVDTGGKINIFRRFQGKMLFLNSMFIIPGQTSYVYSDRGTISPDLGIAGKQTPVYMNADGSIENINSLADYGQRLFMTQLVPDTSRFLFSQVGNTDSMVYSELRNSDEAGFLEVPISNFDSWLKVFAGLDLIMSTSYTISQVQGYGDLTSQVVLFDGLSKVVSPVSVRRSVIYTNSNNRNVYDLSYNEYGQYDALDLTLLIKNVFEQKFIKRFAHKSFPVRTIFALCNDGDLLGLTYIKDQNIYGWYRIKGMLPFHDMLVVDQDTEDRTFIIVKDGDKYRLTETYLQTESGYMDSTIDVPLSEIENNVIEGLEVFEGKKVRVFDTGNNQFYGNYMIDKPQYVEEGGNQYEVDEVEFDGFLVENGKIELPDDKKLVGDIIRVGLPYFAVVETIPLEFMDNNGNSTIGRQKTINDGQLRYGSSRGMSYKTLRPERPLNIPSKDISSDAFFLESGQRKLDTDSEYKWNSTIKILQREPYPARIESITLGITFNDKS